MREESVRGPGGIGGQLGVDKDTRVKKDVPDKVQIAEDERLVVVEPTGDDVLCVVEREPVNLIERERLTLLLEEELFVVWVV